MPKVHEAAHVIVNLHNGEFAKTEVIAQNFALTSEQQSQLDVKESVAIMIASPVAGPIVILSIEDAKKLQVSLLQAIDNATVQDLAITHSNLLPRG